MTGLFVILMLIAMAATVIALFAGLAVMSKGGETAKKYGNRLMQARVLCQGLTLAFFALALLTRGH